MKRRTAFWFVGIGSLTVLAFSELERRNEQQYLDTLGSRQPAMACASARESMSRYDCAMPSILNAVCAVDRQYLRDHCTAAPADKPF